MARITRVIRIFVRDNLSWIQDFLMEKYGLNANQIRQLIHEEAGSA